MTRRPSAARGSAGNQKIRLRGDALGKAGGLLPCKTFTAVIHKHNETGGI